MKREEIYIASLTPEKEIDELYRFWEDEKGRHEEYLTASGTWQQDNSLIRVLRNRHSPYYRQISKKEAQSFKSEFKRRHNFRTATAFSTKSFDYPDDEEFAIAEN